MHHTVLIVHDGERVSVHNISCSTHDHMGTNHVFYKNNVSQCLYVLPFKECHLYNIYLL